MRRTFTLLALAGLGGAALLVLPHASASAVPDTTPALVATGTDALRVVWHGSAPRRLHEQVSTLGRWAEATTFTGARPLDDTSGVGLGADPASGQVLAATVADEQVWVRTAAGGPWSGLGGSATGAPAVAGLGGGAFAVVVRDDEGTVRVRQLRGGRWSGWSSLGGRFSTSPAAVGRSGSLVIAVAGRDRKVRTTVVTGGRPSGWRDTGVVSTATPGLAAEPGTGRLHLITRNRDLTPSARVSVNGARTWGRATRLDGRLGSGIAAASGAAGTVDIAALGLDGRAVQSSLRSGRWSDFRLIAASTATVLPETAVTAVTGDPAGRQTLRFAPDARLPRPGEILAATSTPVTPHGLLVKVRSVDGRTVEAMPARLTEAIPEGTIDETFTLGAGGVTARSAGDPVVQPIRQTVPCSGGATAEITGSVSIAPRFDLDASWTSRGVSAVSFTGTLTEDVQLKTSINGSGSCSLKETALLAAPIRFQPVTFSVGPVPVVITPELQLYLDATGSVRAALATSAGQTASVTAGLAYRDGTVRPVADFSARFTYQPPTVSRNATAQAGVSPKFSFLISGVPGPRLSSRASVRLGGTPQWTLEAGLTAGVRLAVPQLGVDHGRDDVVRYEQALATSSSPATTPVGG
ncbi:hypothetical protein [Actinoplanes auranticolor]|uniref:PLL-like beta propeller domain-containing protein n=1 Tax=Actinoplanes auranticolor TaxID=47988 RepID=A0A919VLQ8_9ACTN|nr:hypothetical protein [Actinoplanes auranticolor]GIM68133.1 hypothetical protein Aau02nite_30280 [Actinoplanes auranticolor]